MTTTISTRTLACGMPLVVESIPGVRSVAVAWHLPAGLATEPEHLQGLAPMWAELIFRGCGGLDSRAQADALDRLGASRSSDVSTFHLRLGMTLLGERLMEALPLLAMMVREPRFDEDSVDPARDLCLQGLESLKDDPSERAVLKARELHQGSPINRSGLGTEAGLEAITRDDLVACWRERVRPAPGPASGAVLAIAGAVDPVTGPDAIARELDRLLRGWEGSALDVRWTNPPHRALYSHVPDESSQVQVVLMHEAPAERDEDALRERVVTSVLSGGMASRLFSEVREKRGLCYSVSSSYATDRTWGRVLAYVGTAPERAQTSLDVLWRELERINGPRRGAPESDPFYTGNAGKGLVFGGIEPEEYQRAVTGMKAGLVFAGESTGARASALASDMHRLGRPRPLSEIAARVDALSLDEINAYLARRRPGRTTIVTLGPTPLTPPPGFAP